MKAAELRKSILQTAVEGKLVPQDPNDEPASVLIERIKQEKERLVRDGVIKKGKHLLPIDTGENPYDLPEGWTWCRLNDIYNFIDYRGKTPKKTTSGIPLVTAANIKKGFMDYSTQFFISLDEFNTRKTRGIAKNGDILFTTEAPLGNVAQADMDVYSTGQRVIALQGYNEELVNATYVNFLLSPEIQMRIYEKRSGMTATGVKAELLKTVIVPLPPAAEQYRIANKIEELMILCAELEQAEKELAVLENQFAEYLPKSILQAAVQGKLGAQDSNDEPAAELLKYTQQKKAKLIRDGKIKKEKPVPPISEEEIPYDLPNGWEWCRLGDVGVFIRGNGIKRTDLCAEGVPCIRYGEIYTTYNIATTKAVSFVSKEIASRCTHLRHGDMLFTLTGENNEEIGKTVAFLGEEETVIGGDLATLTHHQLNPLYLSYLMNSPYPLQQKAKLGTGNIIVHISCSKLSSILIPIPPIAEQQRIVEKVVELMGLCDELKLAHALPILRNLTEVKNIVPLQQKSCSKPVSDKAIPVGIAARGDATDGLSEQASRDADELLGDD